MSGPGSVEVLRTGALATVQDLGRPGLGHLGVTGSGAADRGSLRLANRLVGNPEGAAGIEATLGGLALVFSRTARVACTGAPCPVRLGGRAAGTGTPLVVLAGEVLELGVPRSGLRTYLAVRGGIDVPPVLGARATDTLSGLGPPVLTAGAVLPVGPPPAGTSRPAGEPLPDDPLLGGGLGEVLDVAPQRAHPQEATVRVLAGPRADWFAEGALQTLCSTSYEVTADCDRIGMRLDGPPLPRVEHGELLPEGMVPGALQVPPSGRPILFLADHPVTGGYPVIAVVRDGDLGAAAQLRPGGSIRFALGSPPRRPGTA